VIKLYLKDELILAIKDIFIQGWHKSIKHTIDTRHDGAVGNTLENLLGIEENNLPIPNAQEWELKGQRKHTQSLITLKHIEPSPRAAKIVPSILLPLYGWRHKQAGKKYPETEMSFRSTTSASEFTNRGFRIVVDRKESKLRFVFNSDEVQIEDDGIKEWLNSVGRRIGLSSLNPEPYWGFKDLQYAIGSKMKNCFYVTADNKVEQKHEYFKYEELWILSGFSFDRFIQAVEQGDVLIDFDARTGHNHGTKFRLKQGRWTMLFSEVNRVI
jgi:hypothetical protein